MMKKILKNEETEAVLDKLLLIQPGFKIQMFLSFPCPWIEYRGEGYEDYINTYGEPNHREILEDEIVIDVDAEDKKHGVIHADMVQKRLEKKGYFFRRYQSGGNGEHFHLIFPELTTLFGTNAIEEIKYLMIEYILKGMINPEKLDSHICLFKKKLIQIEHQIHRKGNVKTLKAHNDGLNPIDPEFYTFMEKRLLKRRAILQRISKIVPPSNLNCIKYFEGHTVNKINYYNLKRVNYRALFSLASYYKAKYKDEKKNLQRLYKWYDSLPKIMRHNAKGTVNSKIIQQTAKLTNGSAGCLYRLGLLEELEVDKKVCKNCPYMKD